MIFSDLILTIRIMCIIIYSRGEKMKFKELERIILNDGWTFKKSRGSHFQYIHPTKPGKVTIPKHGGDLDIKTANSILKQAGLK